MQWEGEGTRGKALPPNEPHPGGRPGLSWEGLCNRVLRQPTAKPPRRSRGPIGKASAIACCGTPRPNHPGEGRGPVGKACAIACCGNPRPNHPGEDRGPIGSAAQFECHDNPGPRVRCRRVCPPTLPPQWSAAKAGAQTGSLASRGNNPSRTTATAKNPSTQNPRERLYFLYFTLPNAPEPQA